MTRLAIAGVSVAAIAAAIAAALSGETVDCSPEAKDARAAENAAAAIECPDLECVEKIDAMYRKTLELCK